MHHASFVKFCQIDTYWSILLKHDANSEWEKITKVQINRNGRLMVVRS